MSNNPSEIVRILPRVLVVAAAMLDDDGRVLVQCRPPGKPLAGLWEFPGGKVEPGESPEAALARELAEELGVAVAPADVDPVGFASDSRPERQLLLLLYGVRRWEGLPEARHASALRWVPLEDLTALAMPPLDVPLVAALRRWMALA